jgi:hypothetical protein
LGFSAVGQSNASSTSQDLNSRAGSPPTEAAFTRATTTEAPAGAYGNSPN